MWSRFVWMHPSEKEDVNPSIGCGSAQIQVKSAFSIEPNKTNLQSAFTDSQGRLRGPRRPFEQGTEGTKCYNVAA